MSSLSTNNTAERSSKRLKSKDKLFRRMKVVMFRRRGTEAENVKKTVCSLFAKGPG